MGQLGKIKRSLSVDARWNTWASFVALLVIVALATTVLWLAAGGLAYTGGIAFYLAKQLPYSHFIWHLFVATGTACHFFAVLWYAS